MSATGAIRRNPDTGAAAVRTHFDESNPQLAPMAWLIADPVLGPRNTSSAEVADWDEIYTPDAE